MSLLHLACIAGAFVVIDGTASPARVDSGQSRSGCERLVELRTLPGASNWILGTGERPSDRSIAAGVCIVPSIPRRSPHVCRSIWLYRSSTCLYPLCGAKIMLMLTVLSVMRAYLLRVCLSRIAQPAHGRSHPQCYIAPMLPGAFMDPGRRK